MEKYIDIAMEIINGGYFNAAVNLMDDELREDIYMDSITGAVPIYNIAFLAEYMHRHFEKYGEDFTI